MVNTMNFTVENLEFFILILVRISGFIYVAPFFGQNGTPRKVKAALSVFIAIIIFQTISYETIEYHGVIGYAILVVKECLIGILIGYMASICNYILSFAGNMIDIEIGFSMMNVMNPVAKIQSTITGTLYSNIIMLMLIVTNMHHYLLRAIIETFQLIPINKVEFNPTLYMAMARFLVDFFVIGFRIILPIFAAILLTNIILGILAKVAPQMNMFVIGMQLKIFVGLFVLILVIQLVPQVADFIFGEMKTMMELVIKGMMP